MTDKKENARPKAETRKPTEIFTEKANALGGIMEKQIIKMKKLQTNAIKAGETDKFNKMLTHFESQLNGLQIDESTVISENPDGFDVSKL